jgi:hypothetical protein
MKRGRRSYWISEFVQNEADCKRAASLRANEGRDKLAVKKVEIKEGSRVAALG